MTFADNLPDDHASRPVERIFGLLGQCRVAQRQLAASRPAPDATSLQAERELYALLFGTPVFLMYLADAYVLADRLEDALEVTGRALTVGRESGQRPYEAGVHRLLGEIIARRDPPEHADGHYWPSRARPSWACAPSSPTVTLASSTGASASRSRRKHFSTATTMFHEMDRRFWLELAEAGMRQLA